MTIATAFGATRRAAAREFLAAIGTIMVKELRSRMRGRRAFIILTVYLGILALITYGVYVVVAPGARDAAAFGFGVPGSANASAVIGQWIFTLLSIFQLILVCFIAPAFTAGQISLEREKQTLDLLISTPMRPGAIIVGKLLSALAFAGLMILAAIPISAIVLMYGGASVDDIVRQQFVLLATAVGLGAIGLFYSSLLKRTQAATVLTYITTLALVLGTVMIWIFWTVLLTRDDSGVGFGPPKRAPEQLVYLNPAVAMLDVVANTEPGGYGAINSMLQNLRGGPLGQGIVAVDGGGGNVVCRGDQCFGVDQPVPVPAEGPAGAVPGGFVDLGQANVSGYWWPRFAISIGALSVLLTLASTRLVVPAGMRLPFRRRRARSEAAIPVHGGSAAEAAHVEIEEIGR